MSTDAHAVYPSHRVGLRELMKYVLLGVLEPSLFQGWFTNPYATFQQYCLVPALVAAKVCVYSAI